MNYFRLAAIGYIVTISVSLWLLAGHDETLKGFIWLFLLAGLGLYEFYNYAYDKPMSVGLIYASRVEQKGTRVFILFVSAFFIFLPLLYALQQQSANT